MLLKSLYYAGPHITKLGPPRYELELRQTAIQLGTVASNVPASKLWTVQILRLRDLLHLAAPHFLRCRFAFGKTASHALHAVLALPIDSCEQNR